MTLNLSNAASFKQHIRYMASTSSWSMSLEGEKGQKSFQFTQAVFNLKNIKTGWGLFIEGQAPEWVMDESISKPAAKPQDGREWKRGFKVDVFSKTLFGNVPVREFATTATGAVMGIIDLYKQYEEQAPQNIGKSPVVEYKGSAPLKVGKGNTTVPSLKIVKFVDDPSEFDTSGEISVVAEPAKVAVNEF